MNNMNLSEQEQIRRESLDEIRKLGIDPYPAAEYKTNVFAQDILDNYTSEKNNCQEVCMAGRIMSRRIMGNASFAELMDSSGRIQIYIRRDDVCPGEDLAAPAETPELVAEAEPASEVAITDGFVVQAAAFSTIERAERAAGTLGGNVSQSGRYFRVRTGPFATRDEAEASLANVRAAGYSDARIYSTG